MITFVPNFPKEADVDVFLEHIAIYPLQSHWLIVYTFTGITIDNIYHNSKDICFELTNNDLKRMDDAEIYYSRENNSLIYRDKDYKIIKQEPVCSHAKYKAKIVRRREGCDAFFLNKNQNMAVLVYDDGTKNYKVLNLKYQSVKMSSDGSTIALANKKEISVIDNPL